MKMIKKNYRDYASVILTMNYWMVARVRDRLNHKAENCSHIFFSSASVAFHHTNPRKVVHRALSSTSCKVSWAASCFLGFESRRIRQSGGSSEGGHHNS